MARRPWATAHDGKGNIVKVPAFLLLISLIGVVVALILPGYTDLIFAAGPGALASLFLLLRAYFRNVRSRRRSRKNYIVIDGSNAMHWKDGTPQISTLREVVDHLAGLGFTPGVIFDANVGHLVAGKYRHNRAMGKLLGLDEDRVIVVSKGSPADPTILKAARFLGARVVTNDRYRDWAAAHPEVNEPGFLIRGGYREGRLWLEVGDNSAG